MPAATTFPLRTGELSDQHRSDQAIAGRAGSGAHPVNDCGRNPHREAGDDRHVVGRGSCRRPIRRLAPLFAARHARGRNGSRCRCWIGRCWSRCRWWSRCRCWSRCHGPCHAACHPAQFRQGKRAVREEHCDVTPTGGVAGLTARLSADTHGSRVRLTELGGGARASEPAVPVALLRAMGADAGARQPQAGRPIPRSALLFPAR